MIPTESQPEGSPAPRPRQVIIQRAPAAPISPPVEERSGRGGCFWATVAGLIIILIPLLLLAALVFAGITTLNNIAGGFEAMFTGFNRPATVSIASSQTIVTSIQSMGQLVSVGAQLAKADIDVHIEQGVLGATSFTTSHVAQGAVEAGIDLTQFGADNVRYDGFSDTYTITLPPAQLTSCRVDYIRQYDYSGTILQVDRDEARLLAQYKALVDFRDEAVEGGLLTRAETQATLIFSNIVQALTNSRVRIEFGGEQPPLPSSCEPPIPGNWTYDPANQVWTRPD
jgi:hypothetical protein